MSTLISVHNLGKSQAGRTLFEDISFGIEEKSNVALIGPNGAGKTTLLKILSSMIEADEGSISKSKQCRMAFLEQNPSFNPELNLLDAILGDFESSSDPSYEQKAYELISKLGFDDAGLYSLTPISTLSGGWVKKAALAREIIKDPNLFLLDEPTNHLDIESILWLEDFLNQSNFATLTITHDRSFLQNTSSEIIELNKCYSTGFLKIKGDYSNFCQIKADIISGQGQAEASASNRLRREMEWMRKSPRARATKSRARMKKTEELQEEVGKMQYRAKEVNVKIEFKNHVNAPKKLIDAEGISKSFSGQCVFSDFDLIVERKSRIGLIGANGAGKSTLLKTLLGELESDSGKLKRSDLLNVNYFAQDKKIEDSDVSLLNFFSESGDTVNFCGAWVHVHSYLARFGFAHDQFSTKVRDLSGGEKSRLLIAKLMLNESNLLVLDEPTNDLDLTTLNILEDQLAEFKGAIILVSHDRFFLDQVCNEIYAFSPNSDTKTLTRFSDIHQWSSWHEQELNRESSVPAEAQIIEAAATSAPVEKLSIKKKLSYKEKFEFENMEANIASKEKELENLTSELQNVSQGSGVKVVELSKSMGALQKEIEALYSRWEELSARQ